ncbi:MAG TPA: thioredoxin family protein [Flavobacteriaceae bacterium]|jgi:thioredoxin-related protein|nr:thioredoxin family protein [Flavobacteriaceae bacterium]HIN97841.1 thioredoxin family protein [Flavobacteriaceae bacterium]|tara:strand:- start:86151 stop:86591 length:441 start_codon:yes stop_codon:yes gene_type:complete
MKELVILLILFFTALPSLVAQEWQTNFEDALEIASEENKPIILVFQGSDWCAPCIKLDREIWSSEVFKKYAADHYVMLQANFPRKKMNALSETQTKANAKLAETYNKQGFFPHVVILDSKGNVLGETGYKKTTPEKYINVLNTYID